MDILEILSNPSIFIGKTVKVDGWITRAGRGLCILATKDSDDCPIYVPRTSTPTFARFPPQTERIAKFLHELPEQSESGLTKSKAQEYIRFFKESRDAKYLDEFMRFGYSDALTILFPYEHGKSTKDVFHQLSIEFTRGEVIQGSVNGELIRDESPEDSDFLLTNLTEATFDHEDFYFYAKEEDYQFKDIDPEFEDAVNVFEVLHNRDKYLDKTIGVYGIFTGDGIKYPEYTISPNISYFKTSSGEIYGKVFGLLIDVESSFTKLFSKHIVELSSLSAGLPFAFDIYLVGDIGFDEHLNKVVITNTTTAITRQGRSIFKWKI